jgi:uncharacterized protein YcbK (DUF882 family)
LAIRRLSRTLLRKIEYGAQLLPDGYYFEIVSGVRSNAEQAELRRRWDSGDRAGLIARPALNSAHVLGRAVDLNLRHENGQRWTARETPELFESLGLALRPYGVRWYASDLNHYEV